MVRRHRWARARGGAKACAGLAFLSCVAAVGCTLLDIGPLDVGPRGVDASSDVGVVGPADEDVGLGHEDAADRAQVGGDGGSTSDVSPLADVTPPDVRLVSHDGPTGDGPDGSGDDGPPPDGPGTMDEGGCGTSTGGLTGQVLFAFANTGETAGWQQNTNSGGPTATLGWTAADGHACAGALSLTVGFHAYDGVAGSAIYTPAAGSSWMATKRLHAWVKLAPLADAGSLDYAALGSLEVSVTSNGWANYSFIAQEVNPAFSDGGWHEVVLEFKAASGGQPGRLGPDVVPSSVQRIGVLLSSATSRPPGSAAAPPSVLLLLDDVWVE